MSRALEDVTRFGQKCIPRYLVCRSFRAAIIPAFWSYVAAWNSYQDSGRLTRCAAGLLAVGIVLTVAALALLFSLSAGLFWPVLLLVGGLVLLGTAWLPG
jgi:hypothetical protein